MYAVVADLDPRVASIYSYKPSPSYPSVRLGCATASEVHEQAHRVTGRPGNREAHIKTEDMP